MTKMCANCGEMSDCREGKIEYCLPCYGSYRERRGAEKERKLHRDSYENSIRNLALVKEQHDFCMKKWDDYYEAVGKVDK